MQIEELNEKSLLDTFRHFSPKFKFEVPVILRRLPFFSIFVCFFFVIVQIFKICHLQL